MTDHTDSLRAAIKKLHGCDSQHVESVPVTESFQGKVVWDGVVEVFDLLNHPSATRCYAWNHEENGGSERFMAVLECSPVDSPVSAVRAAIVAESKKHDS